MKVTRNLLGGLGPDKRLGVLIPRVHPTVLTDQGPLPIRSPRDRKGTCEPQIVKKRQTRWVGFDDRVIRLYACELTVRQIQGHLAEIYGTEVRQIGSPRSPTP